MLDFLTRNWVLVLLFVAMAWMHLGHGGQAGHDGTGGHRGGCGVGHRTSGNEEALSRAPSADLDPLSEDRRHDKPAPAWGTPPRSAIEQEAARQAPAPSGPHLSPGHRQHRGC